MENIVYYRTEFPKDLHQNVKALAKEHGTTIKHLIISGLRFQLSTGRPASVDLKQPS